MVFSETSDEEKIESFYTTKSDLEKMVLENDEQFFSYISKCRFDTRTSGCRKTWRYVIKKVKKRLSSILENMAAETTAESTDILSQLDIDHFEASVLFLNFYTNRDLAEKLCTVFTILLKITLALAKNHSRCTRRILMITASAFELFLKPISQRSIQGSCAKSELRESVISLEQQIEITDFTRENMDVMIRVRLSCLVIRSSLDRVPFSDVWDFDTRITLNLCEFCACPDNDLKAKATFFECLYMLLDTRNGIEKFIRSIHAQNSDVFLRITRYVYELNAENELTKACVLHFFGLFERACTIQTAYAHIKACGALDEVAYNVLERNDLSRYLIRGSSAVIEASLTGGNESCDSVQPQSSLPYLVGTIDTIATSIATGIECDHRTEAFLISRICFIGTLLIECYNRDDFAVLYSQAFMYRLRIFLDNSWRLSIRTIEAVLCLVEELIQEEPQACSAFRIIGIHACVVEVLKRSTTYKTFDSLFEIGNVLDALCIDAEGSERIASSECLRDFFSSFGRTTATCCVLDDKNVEGLGDSFNELVRHHPSLTRPVCDGIFSWLDVLRYGLLERRKREAKTQRDCKRAKEDGKSVLLRSCLARNAFERYTEENRGAEENRVFYSFECNHSSSTLSEIQSGIDSSSLTKLQQSTRMFLLFVSKLTNISKSLTSLGLFKETMCFLESAQFGYELSFLLSENYLVSFLHGFKDQIHETIVPLCRCTENALTECEERLVSYYTQYNIIDDRPKDIKPLCLMDSLVKIKRFCSLLWHLIREQEEIEQTLITQPIEIIKRLFSICSNLEKCLFMCKESKHVYSYVRMCTLELLKSVVVLSFGSETIVFNDLYNSIFSLPPCEFVLQLLCTFEKRSDEYDYPKLSELHCRYLERYISDTVRMSSSDFDSSRRNEFYDHTIPIRDHSGGLLKTNKQLNDCLVLCIKTLKDAICLIKRRDGYKELRISLYAYKASTVLFLTAIKHIDNPTLFSLITEYLKNVLDLMIQITQASLLVNSSSQRLVVAYESTIEAMRAFSFSTFRVYFLSSLAKKDSLRLVVKVFQDRSLFLRDFCESVYCNGIRTVFLVHFSHVRSLSVIEKSKEVLSWVKSWKDDRSYTFPEPVSDVAELLSIAYALDYAQRRSILRDYDSLHAFCLFFIEASFDSVLLLLVSLTRRSEFCDLGCAYVTKVLETWSSMKSDSKNNKRHNLVVLLLRQLLEDTSVLIELMSMEIKNAYGGVVHPLNSIVTRCTTMVARRPACFLQAVSRVCTSIGNGAVEVAQKDQEYGLDESKYASTICAMIGEWKEESLSVNRLYVLAELIGGFPSVAKYTYNAKFFERVIAQCLEENVYPLQQYLSAFFDYCDDYSKVLECASLMTEFVTNSSYDFILYVARITSSVLTNWTIEDAFKRTQKAFTEVGFADRLVDGIKTIVKSITKKKEEASALSQEEWYGTLEENVAADHPKHYVLDSDTLAQLTKERASSETTQSLQTEVEQLLNLASTVLSALITTEKENEALVVNENRDSENESDESDLADNADWISLEDLSETTTATNENRSVESHVNLFATAANTRRMSELDASEESVYNTLVPTCTDMVAATLVSRVVQTPTTKRLSIDSASSRWNQSSKYLKVHDVPLLSVTSDLSDVCEKKRLVHYREEEIAKRAYGLYTPIESEESSGEWPEADVDVLTTLPDEVRRDAIAQLYEQRRSSGRRSPSRRFLRTLPDNIRIEFIRQHLQTEEESEESVKEPVKVVSKIRDVECKVDSVALRFVIACIVKGNKEMKNVIKHASKDPRLRVEIAKFTQKVVGSRSERAIQRIYELLCYVSQKESDVLYSFLLEREAVSSIVSELIEDSMESGIKFLSSLILYYTGLVEAKKRASKAEPSSSSMSISLNERRALSDEEIERVVANGFPSSKKLLVVLCKSRVDDEQFIEALSGLFGECKDEFSHSTTELMDRLYQVYTKTADDKSLDKSLEKNKLERSLLRIMRLNARVNTCSGYSSHPLWQYAMSRIELCSESRMNPFCVLLEALVYVATEKDSPISKFLHAHSSLVNRVLRSNESMLLSAFTILLWLQVLSFDNKVRYLRMKLGTRHSCVTETSVSRSSIFEDSYDAIMSYSGEELRTMKLRIVFTDEQGVDAGGLLREWFVCLMREVVKEDYVLFKTHATGHLPNEMSHVNPEHLSYYRFSGRIVGKAIYEECYVDCRFSSIFYKCVFNREITLEDLAQFDRGFHSSVSWLLRNDVSQLGLVFAVDSARFGTTTVVDLIENGRNVSVNNENKGEYVKLLVDMRLKACVSQQVAAFRKGLFEVIPEELLSIFTETELDTLLNGCAEIDVDDWRVHTEYVGYTSGSVQVQWFWKIVKNFTQEERALLLKFVTGSPRTPPGGFSELKADGEKQKFQLHRENSVLKLPVAHTCFNQLDLPAYGTLEEMRKNLVKAITECSGFELV